MTDVVVTVAERFWSAWIAEGDAVGSAPSGEEYAFTIPTRPARLLPGERVYVVAGGRLRGFAPLVRVQVVSQPIGAGQWRQSYALIRAGDAEAVTIPTEIPGFRGYRYRWWSRADEIPFPEWRTL